MKKRYARLTNIHDINFRLINLGKMEIRITNWDDEKDVYTTVTCVMPTWYLKYIAIESRKVVNEMEQKIEEITREI